MLNGLQLIQRQAKMMFITHEALKACFRIQKKSQVLVTGYPNGIVPQILYDIYDTVPITAILLNGWLKDITLVETELDDRINQGIGILSSELRSNALFEKIHAELKQS